MPALTDATAPHTPGALRAVAARALGEIGAPDAVPTLTGLAVDPEDRVAVNASLALTWCGPAGWRALAGMAENPQALQPREALLLASLRERRPVPEWAAIQVGRVS